MIDNDEKDFIMQSDWKRYINDKLGSENWVTVYSSNDEATEHTSIFSAIFPKSKIKQALSNTSWDLRAGEGTPSLVTYYTAGKAKTVYERFPNGYEPIVIKRSFSGLKTPYIEILEEFRLFHNLYFDSKNNNYIKITENGDDEVVIKIKGRSVEVRRKELIEFLFAKKYHLAVFFEIRRYSNIAVDDIPQEKLSEKIDSDNITYTFYMSGDRFYNNGYNTLSMLCGKKILNVPSRLTSVKKQYAEFIIGQDRDFNPVSFTCNPSKLSDYYGLNEGAPNFLTPVFFKRDVLSKYYSSQKYKVEDGSVKCGHIWSLYIDNNHSHYVIVFLGYLGQSLSYEEQLYWKSCNVPPDGTISAVAYKRGFLALFTDPEKLDLIFKHRFASFQEKWQKNKGWYLFKPLNEGDAHFYNAIRIPLTNDQAEFDAQVQSLAKLIIESLNEAEIEKHLDDPKKDIKGGISKFEAFLKSESFTDIGKHVEFLRNLQDLRSGVAHRKGDKYKRAVKHFQMDSKELKAVFEEILQSSCSMLDELSEFFLGK